MKFYASKFSNKTLRWSVLTIAMFYLKHRNVFFRIFRAYFVFSFFIKCKLNTK